MGKSPKCLTNVQVVELALWLQSHKLTLETECRNREDVAIRASTELGFPVTRSHIETIGSHSSINLQLPSQNRSAGDRFPSKVVALARILEILWKSTFHAKVGLPKSLHAVAMHKTEKEIYLAYQLDIALGKLENLVDPSWNNMEDDETATSDE